MEVRHLLVLYEDLLGLELSLTQQTGQLVPVRQSALVQDSRVVITGLLLIAVTTVGCHQTGLTTAGRLTGRVSL